MEAFETLDKHSAVYTIRTVFRRAAYRPALGRKSRLWLWCKRWMGLEVALDHAASTATPNLGSGFVFEAKPVEFELTLSYPVHEFDAGDGRRGSSEMLEAEHRTKPQLDRSMVLFNQIVDVFGRPDLALISLGMFAESLRRPAM